MQSNEAVARLEEKGIKPTANRILILQKLVYEHRPLSLTDIESLMPRMDKSSIFRVLTLFLEHEMVHAFADGRGILHYELCESKGACNHNDSHVHFYCESCKKTYCLTSVKLPTFPLPQGFTPHTYSFIVKGECNNCRRKSHHE